MVPVEELLKHKIVKISFAEVAEYLRQVIAEKYAQEQRRLSAISEGTPPPSEHTDGLEVAQK
jgi:hypothetical protein